MQPFIGRVQQKRYSGLTVWSHSTVQYSTAQYSTVYHTTVQYIRPVVLKLFHVEDPQIDTYQPADPQLKSYDGDAHKREDYYSSNSDFQPFSLVWHAL